MFIFLAFVGGVPLAIVFTMLLIGAMRFYFSFCWFLFRKLNSWTKRFPAYVFSSSDSTPQREFCCSSSQTDEVKIFNPDKLVTKQVTVLVPDALDDGTDPRCSQPESSAGGDVRRNIRRTNRSAQTIPQPLPVPDLTRADGKCTITICVADYHLIANLFKAFYVHRIDSAPYSAAAALTHVGDPQCGTLETDDMPRVEPPCKVPEAMIASSPLVPSTAPVPKCTIEIFVKTSLGFAFNGYGVFINNFLVTPYHVVRGKEVSILGRALAGFIKSNEFFDLCYLPFNPIDIQRMGCVNAKTAEAPEGQAKISFRDGVSFGQLTRIPDFCYLHDASTLPGSSGAPLTSSSGKKIYAVHVGAAVPGVSNLAYPAHLIELETVYLQNLLERGVKVGPYNVDPPMPDFSKHETPPDEDRLAMDQIMDWKTQDFIVRGRPYELDGNSLSSAPFSWTSSELDRGAHGPRVWGDEAEKSPPASSVPTYAKALADRSVAAIAPVDSPVVSPATTVAPSATLATGPVTQLVEQPLPPPVMFQDSNPQAPSAKELALLERISQLEEALRTGVKPKQVPQQKFSYSCVICKELVSKTGIKKHVCHVPESCIQGDEQPTVAVQPAQVFRPRSQKKKPPASKQSMNLSEREFQDIAHLYDLLRARDGRKLRERSSPASPAASAGPPQDIMQN